MRKAPNGGERPPDRARSLAPGVLAALGALALLVRVAPFWRQVLHKGGVVLPGADPYYHLRRVLYTVHRWPRVLDLDRWIAVPHGARAVWPPLFDWIPATFAHWAGLPPTPVAALWPPVLGALAVWPLYQVVRRLGGGPAGLTAAAIWTVLPQAVRLAPFGRLDHHVAEVLLLLFAVAATLRLHERLGGDSRSGPAADPGDATGAPPALRAAFTPAIGLGLVVGATLTTWPGAPLVLLVPALGAAVLAASTARDAGAWRFPAVFLAAHLAGALLAAPLAVSAWRAGRPLLSARFLSVLQPLLIVGLGALPLAAVVLARATWRQRVALALAAVGGSFALAALYPPARAALVDGLRFIDGSQSRWFSEIAESHPLYRDAKSASFAAVGLGAWAFALPFLAVGALAAAARAGGRSLAWNLAAGLAALGAILGTLQLRFLGYAAPVVCAAAPLVAGWLARRGRSLAAVSLVVSLALFWPAARFWRPTLAGRPAPLGQIPAPLFNLLGRVRVESPSPGDPERPEVAPSYAVFAPWYVGHWVLGIAKRPVVANNFGVHLRGGGYQATRDFFWGQDRQTPSDAVRLLERFPTRYVLSTWAAVTEGPRPWSERFAGRLHVLDGTDGLGGEGSGRLRLVDESSAVQLGARGSASPPKTPVAPYKLFELVLGARIEVRAAPGDPVRVASQQTLRRRRFEYRRRTRADEDGRARVRVAYPGFYAIGAPGGRAAAVEVSESAVRGGGMVRVELPKR